MLAAGLTALLTSFTLPGAPMVQRSRATVTMGLFDNLPKLPDGLPSLPKIDLGGIEIESFGDKWNKPGDLKLIPSDVQFQDVDGDTITLREVRNGKVDYYVGKELKLESATLVQSGNSLQVSGKVNKGTPLSFLGFNLEESITDQMTPADPADLAKAMALVPNA